jgi:polysaccharide export outer membrane protein
MIKAMIAGALGGSIAFGSCWAAPPALPAAVFGPLSAPQSPHAIRSDYQLGPFDKISVVVYGQEKLSAMKIQIDAGGQVVLPLIGVVTAGGKTAGELSTEVAERLGDKYLEAPQVSVVIEDAVSQRITVTGAVTEAGVFSLKGPTTLLQAVAMAKGVDVKSANTKHVAIFRQIDGRNERAVFDLKAISLGQAQDPQVLSGDSVVVEGSEGKQFWHELVTALPAIGVFAYF